MLAPRLPPEAPVESVDQDDERGKGESQLEKTKAIDK